MPLTQKGETDRRITLIDAATILAEHVHSFGGDVASLIADLHMETQSQLWTLQDEAAFERMIEEQADREGLRY